MSQCPVCKMIHECMVCGRPVPEYPAKEYPTSDYYEVEYENGSKHTLVGPQNCDDAIELSNITLARSAGLCLAHLSRAIECRKIINNKRSKNNNGIRN